MDSKQTNPVEQSLEATLNQTLKLLNALIENYNGFMREEDHQTILETVYSVAQQGTAAQKKHLYTQLLVAHTHAAETKEEGYYLAFTRLFEEICPEEASVIADELLASARARPSLRHH